MAHRSVEEHAAHIRDLIAPALVTGSETVALRAALGRVTATAIVSPVDLPLFRNSQMDGFAVIAADLASALRTGQPVTLPIVGEVAARPGTPPPLAAGTAVRIMTGAVVPEGADAIVPVEDTTATADTVTITRGRRSADPGRTPPRLPPPRRAGRRRNRRGRGASSGARRRDQHGR